MTRSLLLSLVLTLSAYANTIAAGHLAGFGLTRLAWVVGAAAVLALLVGVPLAEPCRRWRAPRVVRS